MLPIVVPTPAAANTVPSDASICGRTTAQPIEFDELRPSFTGAKAGGRSHAITQQQRNQDAEPPSKTRVTDLGSISPRLFSGV